MHALHSISPAGLVLLVVLLVLMLGAYPGWGIHNRGYAPLGGLGGVLVVVVILLILGVI